MFHITISLLSDVMLWGTLPLTGLMGVWERHLSISATDQKLLQLLLLIVVFAWANFWNMVGMRQRIARYQSSQATHPTRYSFNGSFTSEQRAIIFSNNGVKPGDSRKENSVDKVEQLHVSNN